jgi:deoxycytidine triphosphate deaminase
VPSLADNLRRSLERRALGFAAHLRAIAAENDGVSKRFHEALSLIETYTEALIRHTSNCWEGQNEFERMVLVREMSEHLLDKEMLVDQNFARSGHSSVPRSLARRVEEEFDLLNLPVPVKPVLTVGPPGNFETYVVDLRGALFHDLWSTDYFELDAYKTGLYSLITVPYLEGTRAFWEPLVVGHEVGHVAIYYRANLYVPGAQINRYLDELHEELDLPKDSDTVLQWTPEILCDLNTLRIYGPAAVAALAEFLSVSGRPSHMTQKTHPPRSARVRILLAALSEIGLPEEMGHLVEPWRAVANEPLSRDTPLQAFVDCYVDRVSHLWNEVKSWGGVYDYAARTSEIGWISERLSKGIPGGLSEESAAKAGSFCDADIINAAWSFQIKQHSASPKKADLTDSVVDRLALKALDNLEFAQLWTRGGGELVSIDKSDDPRHYQYGAGVLSGSEIRARLARVQNELVVTPLLDGSIRDASLDVRLSPSFIVFKHSATTVFDALREDQNPRDMQEAVEKEWGERFILHPGELVLAATLEYLSLPTDLVGQVITRSSYGRLGLLSVTASQIQPGSCGVITLELVNLSRTPLALRAGQRVAQITFSSLEAPEAVPSSNTYRYPTGPEFSLAQNDWDNPMIIRIRETLRDGLG